MNYHSPPEDIIPSHRYIWNKPVHRYITVLIWLYFPKSLTCFSGGGCFWSTVVGVLESERVPVVYQTDVLECAKRLEVPTDMCGGSTIIFNASSNCQNRN
jgi:hypothetical protein